MKKILIILIIILMVVCVVGCNSQDQNTAGQQNYADSDEMEPNDDGLDGAEGETAGVDDGDGNGEEIVVDTEDAKITVNKGEWPEEAPEEVPQLEAGTISVTTITSLGGVVKYTDVDREAADMYAANLESNGWQKISESIDSDWMQVFFLKDGIYLDIEWEIGDCYITWSEN